MKKRYRTFNTGIERSIAISNVRCRYRKFDTGIERSILVSNVPYRYRTLDTGIDTGIERSLSASHVGYRYRTLDTSRYDRRRPPHKIMIFVVSEATPAEKYYTATTVAFSLSDGID